MNSRHASVAAFVLVCLASPIASAQEVSIASDAFSGVFLRLDANGVAKTFHPSGAGTVNGQFGSFTWEKFCLRPQGDGTITIESVNFPGFFLRLDGSAVNNTFHPSGAGVVNVQWGAYGWEHFWPRTWGGNKFTYESAAFPNVFLRLDGNGVTHFLPAGGGKANAQFAAYAWEHFTRVTVAPSC